MENLKEAIIEKWLEGYKINEIAKALNISRVTVRAYLKQTDLPKFKTKIKQDKGSNRIHLGRRVLEELGFDPEDTTMVGFWIIKNGELSLKIISRKQRQRLVV
mgnify:CR=1 FL=1